MTEFINIRKYFETAWKNIVKNCAKNPPNFMPYDLSNKNPHAFITAPTISQIVNIYGFDGIFDYTIPHWFETFTTYTAWKFVSVHKYHFTADKNAFIDNQITRLLLALIYEHYQNLFQQPQTTYNLRCVEHILCNNYLVKNVMKY